MIYVSSERAAASVMDSSQFVERRLIAAGQSRQVGGGAATWRPFHGFAFLRQGGEVKVGIDPKAAKRAKDHLRQGDLASLGSLDGAADPRDQPLQRGWTAHFPWRMGRGRSATSTSGSTAVSGMLPEPPDADRHVRGVGGAGVSPAPYPIRASLGSSATVARTLRRSLRAPGLSAASRPCGRRP
jgi:hypothetical protein